MSFSSDVKEELSKVNNLSNKIQVKYEFIGYLISNNSSVVGNKIRYATESQYNINRFAKLLSNLKIDYKIEMEGKSFVIVFLIMSLTPFLYIYIFSFLIRFLVIKKKSNAACKS